MSEHFTHCDHGVKLTETCQQCASPWTVQRFLELLDRHDASKGVEIGRVQHFPARAHLDCWINLESLVEELNAKEKG